MNILYLFLTVFVSAIVVHCTVSQGLFPVSIVHLNDFHARFEETDMSAAPCGDGANNCIGGYARIVSKVNELLLKHKDSNPIYLNAGDNFQGTLWYTIGRWNVTSHFLNMLPADAITLGNHEFDNGIEGVVPFLETIKSPMVIANIDDSEEPSIQGKYKNSIIIDKYDRKIGIIGVILQTTDQIANTGRLKFTNESEAIIVEAERLKNEGVDIIIVLSHCGLDVDRIIAKHAGPYIDVIVGGHSHTFLYTGDNPPGPDTPRDVYPVVVENSNHKVLIVQASCYAKYLGDITVYFDDKGEVVNYEGAPIFLSHDITPDPKILQELQPWKEVIDVQGKREIGKTLVTLSKSTCSYRECNLGNLVTDAFVHAYVTDTWSTSNDWTVAAISICNVGGIRTTLNRGTLTFAHLITALPFENSIDSFDILGRYLYDAFEYAVAQPYDDDGEFSAQNMLQVSGLKIIYNISNPIGNRVVNVEVRCQKCSYPEYHPLDHNSKYRVIAASFLANGGDGFTMINDNKENVKVGAIDINALTEYVQAYSPIVSGEDDRIIVLK